MCNCEVLRLWPSRVLNLITILSALSTTRDVAGNEVQRSKPQTHSSASAQRKALHTLRQMLGYKIAHVKPNKVPQSSLWINRFVLAGMEIRYYRCTKFNLKMKFTLQK